MGAQQGDLTSSCDWLAGLAERLVHFAVAQVEVGAALLKGRAGEGEQVRLRDRPRESAARPVDARLDQRVQQGVGGCRVAVSAQQFRCPGQYLRQPFRPGAASG